MGDVSDMSDDELRAYIKHLEAQGHTASTSPQLRAANEEQTDRLSDIQIVNLIRSRCADGKPIGKLAAAALKRGLRF